MARKFIFWYTRFSLYLLYICTAVLALFTSLTHLNVMRETYRWSEKDVLLLLITIFNGAPMIATSVIRDTILISL